jgi:hypothetical protein
MPHGSYSLGETAAEQNMVRLVCDKCGRRGQYRIDQDVAGAGQYGTPSSSFAARLPNMYLMGRRYRPKPYNGRVILFRRSLRAISRYLDANLGWDSVITGEFDVIEIQGGHEDMFDEPQVQRTAAKLAACLQDLHHIP